MSFYLRSICQKLLHTLQEYKEEVNILQEAEDGERKGVSLPSCTISMSRF